MATQSPSRERTTKGTQAMEFAINKTRGLAFSRNGDGEWKSIDPKSVAGLTTMERVSHTKIGDNWFSIYHANGKK